MTSPEPFNAYSRYYDLLYRDKDYAAEAGYVHRLLEHYGVPGNEILEFGSGTGKHGRLLAGHGYRVTGIERSAEMVAQAVATDGFMCQQGDIRESKQGRTFDAVLSLFHVISYQVSNADVSAVFDNAAEHLQPGGLFVFDVWYSPAVYAQRPEVRVKRLVEDDLSITRIAEPEIFHNENRVDVNYTIFAEDGASGESQTFTENHPMRHFSLPELDLLASVAGFERVCAEAFLTGEPAGEETWGVCLVLRRL